MLLCAMFDDFVALSLPRVAPSSDVSSNVRESRTAGPFLALLAGWRVCVDGPPLAACRLTKKADAGGGSRLAGYQRFPVPRSRPTRFHLLALGLEGE